MCWVDAKYEAQMIKDGRILDRHIIRKGTGISAPLIKIDIVMKSSIAI
uniref:Uncharacterized protein n=1 Tax=Anguilla anguilla TaxID=7936 RepID=A0A0E9VS46_ANGAN